MLLLSNKIYLFLPMKAYLLLKKMALKYSPITTLVAVTHVLHNAVKEQDSNLVSALLKNFHSRFGSGFPSVLLSALLFECTDGDTAQSLIRWGANVNETLPNGYSVLNRVISRGNIDLWLVTALIEMRATEWKTCVQGNKFFKGLVKDYQTKFGTQKNSSYIFL